MVEIGEAPRLDLLSVVGFCLITVILGFLSIFVAIGVEVNIFLLVTGIAYLVIDRHHAMSAIGNAFRISATGTTWLLWLPCLVAIILYSALPPSMFDSGLYHAQTVQWIEKYKAVKGLGNLHDRLAFNSTFFLPCALFGFSFLKTGPFHVLNGFLHMLFSFSLVSYLTCSGNRTKSYGVICGILFYFLFRLVGDHYRIPSPTPDPLATFLVWFIALCFLFRQKSDTGIRYDFCYFSLICLAFFSVTVKLSIFPVVLIVPYLLFLCRHSLTKKHLCWATVAAFVILTPWIVRNIILSGYLVFPFPSLDIFTFDWKVPKVDVVYARDFIRAWTRIPIPGDPMKPLSLPLLGWFPAWYDECRSIDKLIFILASLSPLVLLLHWRRIKQDLDEIVVWAISYAGVIFWFFSAPDHRFGYGFLCVSVSVAVYISVTHITPGLFVSKPFRAILMIFVFVWGLHISRDAVSYLRDSDPRWFAHRLLTPGKYTTVDVPVRCVRNLCVSVVPRAPAVCWYAPLPCTNALKPGLEGRGPDLSDGFRIAGR